MTLTITLASHGTVELSAYDLAGRTVMATVYSCLASGSHNVSRDAEGVAAGIYLLSLGFSGETRTLRVVRFP